MINEKLRRFFAESCHQDGAVSAASQFTQEWSVKVASAVLCHTAGFAFLVMTMTCKFPWHALWEGLGLLVTPVVVLRTALGQTLKRS